MLPRGGRKLAIATKTIEARYIEKFGESERYYERGKSLFPGGVTHQTSFRKPFPIYFKRGSAGLKYDVGGNELVDYVMGNGSLILGHAHPAVVAAIASAAPFSTHLSGPNVMELEWAELLKALVPSIETLRFATSGTEATYGAMRIARNYTGKPKIVKLNEHYHGWHEYALPGSGSPDAYMPPGVRESIIVLPADTSAIKQVLDERDDVAGVIVEANGAHWGTVPLPNPKFLLDVQQMCRSHGVVFMLDEVVTGFRLSRGGAQVRWGVTPDLTTYGKIVSGGEPGAAVGGRRDIMEMLAITGDPEWDNKKRVAQGGTFNANPTSAAAGIACLQTIRDEPINQRADANAATLKDGLNRVFEQLGIVGHAHGVSSIVHVNIGFDCPCDREICTMTHEQIFATMPADRTRTLRMAMLVNGVDMMGGRGFLVSAAHRAQDIELTVDAFEQSLLDLKQEAAI